MATRPPKAKKAVVSATGNGHAEGSTTVVSNLTFAMLDWAAVNLEFPISAGTTLKDALPRHQLQPDDEQTKWSDIKSDEDQSELVDRVRKLRTELEAFVLLWGQEQGIEDLSLQQVATQKKAGVQSSWFYNPIGGRERSGQWVKVDRIGKKPVSPPVWWMKLVKAKTVKNWQYDPKTGKRGSEITDEMLSKFRARGEGAKLTEAEEEGLDSLFE